MNETEKDHLLLAMQRVHRWRMAFFGLVILLAGVAIGGSLALIFGQSVFEQKRPGPERSPERMIRALRRELNLSTEQADELEDIIRRHMKALDSIRVAVRPEIIEQLELMNEEISSLLNEQQQSLWQRHFEQLQRDLERGLDRQGGERHRPPPRPDRREPDRGEGPLPRYMDRPR